ncbi:MAG: porin [Porticoccaceae bacterium]|nr:porin [Porticoccaceae bacterium]
MLNTKQVALLTVTLVNCFVALSVSALDIDKVKVQSNILDNTFFQELDAGLRLNLDSNRFDGIYREDQQDGYTYDSQLRRARLSLKLPIAKNWSSKLQVALNEGDDSYEIKDLYIRYKGFDVADIKIGQSKEPFGLENLTSSANTLLTERALAVFALGRSKGINLSNYTSQYTWSVGAYNVEQNGKVKADGDKAYTARATFSPVNTIASYNHIGVAYSKRDLQGAEYELKTNGGVDSAVNLVDTKNIAADTVEKSGVEIAWGRGPLSLQGEYQRLQINASEALENATYEGYYSQLSYFLTDDHRAYKKGRFTSVKPSSSAGAWELILRKGTLQSVHIGSANKNTDIEIVSTVLGVNYYLSKRIKFMLNAIDTDASGIDNGNSGSALSLRAQIKL